jgi:hypothetical protein
MLEYTASNFATVDMVYLADKVAEEGMMSWDQYLGNVRLLLHKQFFHRADAESGYWPLWFLTTAVTPCLSFDESYNVI